MATSRPCEGEFRVGIYRAGSLPDERDRVERVLALVSIVEFDAAAAGHYARARAHLLNIGRPVGQMDILIASVSLATGEAIVTRNPRHFAHIPGLVVDTY